MRKFITIAAITTLLGAPTFANINNNTIIDIETAPETPYYVAPEPEQESEKIETITNEVPLNYTPSETNSDENSKVVPAVVNRVVTSYTQPPVWEEYVPVKYHNPRTDFSYGASVAELSGGILLTCGVFSAPIGIPMIIHSSTKLKNIDYANRKIKFEKGLEHAESIQNPTHRRVYYKTLLKECKLTEEKRIELKKKREKQAVKQERIKQREIEKINNIN